MFKTNQEIAREGSTIKFFHSRYKSKSVQKQHFKSDDKSSQHNSRQTNRKGPES